MKSKPEIEATLERSLRGQVQVPRLDGRFDAGVWARIEAGEARRAAPVVIPSRATPMAARLLNIINIVGLGAVAIFLCMFGAQMVAGMDLSGMSLQFSAATSARILELASVSMATVALAIGLMFTPVGRKLRQELG